MSLLEDVFLENEAGEAQELERIIEGDDYDERPRTLSDSDENSAREDEAEEDKQRVDPTSAKPKRVIKNPRFVLNPARLTGPRGIQVLPEHFKDFRFKGKGHEKDDLDLVLKKLEHWAYRLYPKFQFQDCLRKIETLGKKRAVTVHLTKIRMDLITSEETVVQKDSSDEEATPMQEPEEDEFDKLLQQQIEIARATPAPSSVKKTPFSDRSSMMPKATSSPSINDEQRERMLHNRKMAEERRMARLKQNISHENPTETEVATLPIKPDNVEKEHKSAKDITDNDVTNKTSNDIRGSNNIDTVELNTDSKIIGSPKRYGIETNHTSSFVNAEDSSNKNDVEFDNGLEVTKPLKSYLPGKKLNRSRILSSDDDSLNPIDVEKQRNKTKSNLTDSSDDEDLVISERITVDVEQHENIANASKHYESIIEDETVINKSITDVSKFNTDIISDAIVDTEYENVTKNNDIEIQDDEQNECNRNLGNKNNSSTQNCNIVQISIVTDDNIQITDKIEARNERIDEDVLENEIMDVDFSDNF